MSALTFKPLKIPNEVIKVNDSLQNLEIKKKSSAVESRRKSVMLDPGLEKLEKGEPEKSDRLNRIMTII